MKTKQRERVYFNINELFKELKRNIIIIVLIGVLFAGGVSIYTSINSEDLYNAQATIYVKEYIGSLNNTGETQKHIIDDYIFIISSHKVLDEVIDNSDVGITFDELRSYLKVSNPDGTYIIDISITCGKPELAEKLANSIAVVAQKELNELNSAHEITIISLADGNIYQVKPPTTKNCIMAFIFGILLALFIVILRIILKDDIKNSKEAEFFLESKILEVVEKKAKESDFVFLKKCIYKCNNGLKVVLFVNIGVSNDSKMTAVHVADKLRDAGKKVLFINISRDSDIAKTYLNNIVNISNTSSELEELDSYGMHLNEKDSCIDIILLEHRKFDKVQADFDLENVIINMKERYDSIIINFEYLQNRAELITIASASDEVVLVVESNSTKRELAEAAKTQLAVYNENITGIVVREKKKGLI